MPLRTSRPAPDKQPAGEGEVGEDAHREQGLVGPRVARRGRLGRARRERRGGAKAGANVRPRGITAGSGGPAAAVWPMPKVQVPVESR